MNRREKIRLIKGLMLGAIDLEEISMPEVEVWIQIVGTEAYRHYKTGELSTKDSLLKLEAINRRVIRMEYVSGKTIL